jgi:hypothetical protein
MNDALAEDDDLPYGCDDCGMCRPGGVQFREQRHVGGQHAEHQRREQLGNGVGRQL